MDKGLFLGSVYTICSKTLLLLKLQNKSRSICFLKAIQKTI